MSQFDDIKIKKKPMGFLLKDGDKKESEKSKPEEPVEGTYIPLLDGVDLDISRLTTLDDTRARREVRAILKKMDKNGVSLEESINLMVRAVVDHSIDLDSVRRAFKQSIGGMADYIEMMMVGQTMKHLAAEVEATKYLDGMVEDIIKIVKGRELSTPKEKVAAFNALVKWRSERTEYPFKVARLIQDTRLVDRVMDIFENFIRLAKSGNNEWECMVENMPPAERRDMAIVVRSMIEAKNLDLDAINEYLSKNDETSGDT